MNNETLPSPLSGNNAPVPPTPKKRLTPPKNLLFIITIVALLAATGGAIIWGTQKEQAVSEAERRATGLEAKIKDVEAELEKRKTTTGEETINKDRYQAVFLKSGQVYFGKVTKINESQITLEDIYYLRVNGDRKVPDPTNPGEGEDISLVKLGNELHGPEDIMYIERKQIDFYENLKPDSQVSKAIEDYKNQNQPFDAR